MLKNTLISITQKLFCTLPVDYSEEYQSVSNNVKKMAIYTLLATNTYDTGKLADHDNNETLGINCSIPFMNKPECSSNPSTGSAQISQNIQKGFIGYLSLYKIPYDIKTEASKTVSESPNAVKIQTLLDIGELKERNLCDFFICCQKYSKEDNFPEALLKAIHGTLTDKKVAYEAWRESYFSGKGNVDCWNRYVYSAEEAKAAVTNVVNWIIAENIAASRVKLIPVGNSIELIISDSTDIDISAILMYLRGRLGPLPIKAVKFEKDTFNGKISEYYDIMRHMPRCTTRVEFSNCTFSNNTFDVYINKDAVKIKELVISSSDIADIDECSILNFGDVESLIITGHELSNILELLAKIPTLTSLSIKNPLSSLSSKGTVAMPTDMKNLKNLKSLQLDFGKDIEIPKELSLDSITSVEIKVSNKQFKDIKKRFPNATNIHQIVEGEVSV